MTKCECELSGFCNRHKIHKNETLHKLCQTRQDYFDKWESNNGPGQKLKKLAPTLDCPHLQDNHCELATEIAGKPCPTNPTLCLACKRSQRPYRLNQQVLTLAIVQNPELDISHINSVIDETSTGFGTRLANTLGTILPKRAGCGCRGHQDILDVWTPEYIRANLEKVLSWLKNAAKARKLPFSRTLTKALLLGLLATQRTQDQPPPA